MLKKKINTKKVIIIVTILILISLITGIIYGYKYYHKGYRGTEQANTTQSTNTYDKQNNQPASQDANTPVPTQSNTTPAPAPKQPILIKSSGNNGPVPSGVNISFTCTAELGVDCSIILDANGKQTVLGPTKVSDNGRGQFFSSFYWTSVKGSYKVSAQAKNSQGGISSSIVQALEVQ